MVYAKIENDKIVMYMRGAKPDGEYIEVADEIYDDIHNYDYINGAFVKKETILNILEPQNKKQSENKTALAAWLADHPLTWTDGKTYGVTEDDQSEMALNLVQYQLAVSAGQAATLEWHAQKQTCTSFTLEEYTALSLAIAAYVYPYRRYQESVKAAIYAAADADAINAIAIDYASVPA